MVKKKRPNDQKTIIRVRRRCYLVENLKKIRLCRKCNESLEKSMGFGRRCPRCNVYYVDKKTYARYKDAYILLNSDFLEDRLKGTYSYPKSTATSERVNKSSIDSLSITAHDFVVRSYVFKCSNKEHALQDIQATFTIIDRQGNVSKLSVPAGYCPSCDTYYVMDSVFRQIEDKGIPICRTTDLIKSTESLSGWHNKSAYRRMASESILKKFGYSVSQERDLPEEQRRNILAAMVDFEVLTKSEIDSYLSFYIKSKNGQRNADGTLRYGAAIEKWESDRKWLNSYKTGAFKEIPAKRIVINKN